MATEVIDFATLDSAASEVENTPEVDAVVEETEVETPAEGTETETEEGSEKTTEAKAGDKTQKTGKETTAADGKVTPDSISKLLKSMKDANPANASAAKTLRDSYFGEQAFRKEFPTVQEARQAKEFIAAVGGVEGWENTQNVISNIEESDALVHAGDPKIWANIVDDLKSAGKLDSLPKLASGGLDTLKANDPAKFEEVLAPHFVEGLEQVNLPKAISSLEKYLGVLEKEQTEASYAGGKQGVGALKKIVGDMKDWITGLQNEQKTRKESATKVDPEREKFETEKKAFEQQKTEAQQKEATKFKEGVANECDSYSNTTLGAALKPYLKMPFFKDFPRETLVDLGNGIKARLYETLQNDNAYQIQMKGQWKQKAPDKGKILDVHKGKLNDIAEEVVEQTIKQRYPGYAKGGSAAGRVAAAAAKKTATTEASAKSVATGKPIYVATKPKDLVRDSNVVKDWQMLEITGKGYTKGTDGKLRMVTWRK